MSLFLSLIFGAVGTVYMVYGRREQDILFLITGFVLVIYPYFFSNALLIIVIGLLISAVPIARHYGWI
ncbi:MAG: amino acid transport protein [Acidobacteriota bacterium]